MTLASRPKVHPHGLTLLEVLMAISLIAILSLISGQLFISSTDEAKFNKTVDKMNQIKAALIGNLEIKDGGVRTSFGYLGDVGAMPTTAQGIAALVTLPAGVSSYAINSTALIGIGWNGPYLTGGSATTDYTNDGWGTAFVYNGNSSPPTLLSYGADQVAGGTSLNQDITLTLYNDYITTTVSGSICLNGGPFTATAQVELNYPNGSGALTQTLVSVVPAASGAFSFASIPLGVRSISVYIPSKAAATHTDTLGPISITVDKINYVVPCDRVEVSGLH